LTIIQFTIKNNLSPSGAFFLLLPYKRNEEIKNLLLENNLAISNLLFVRQSVAHDYFRIMLAGKINPDGSNETRIEEIAIWNDKQQYTDAFKNLLKDYYLYL